MCNFLSAIVLPTGEIVCDPEHTDSHEDLIESRGLRQDSTDAFCRIELTPPNEPEKLTDVSAWHFAIDQRVRPEWFSDAMQETVDAILRDRVQRMIVTDERSMLLGGCWIVTEAAKINKAKSCRVYSVSGSAEVGSVSGSAKVGYVSGSAKVGSVSGSAEVGSVYGSAKVGSVYDSAKVGSVSGSAKVGSVYDSAKVGYVSGSAEVGYVSGSAEVGYVYDSAKVVNDKRPKKGGAE